MPQLSAILDKLISSLKENLNDADGPEDRKRMRDMRRNMLAHREAIIHGMMHDELCDDDDDGREEKA